MDADLIAFVITSLVIIIVPGVDFALVTRQVVGYGRRAAFATLAGLVAGGLVHATLATLGLSALVLASATLFLVLKIAGAAYLAYLGIQTLWAARPRGSTAPSPGAATDTDTEDAVPVAAVAGRSRSDLPAGLAGGAAVPAGSGAVATAVQVPPGDTAREMTNRRAFTQGISSNLLNPKVIVFYVSFVPQFVHPGPGAAQRTATLALIFITLAVLWWIFYILLVDRLQCWLSRTWVRLMIERLTGVALLALGIRLVFEH